MTTTTAVVLVTGSVTAFRALLWSANVGRMNNGSEPLRSAGPGRHV